MPVSPAHARRLLLSQLNKEQQAAVSNSARRLLVVAGAGSGKTEVMARRVAWWVGVDEVPNDQIVAFTFTEAAAEELKFRIRSWLESIAQQGEDPTLGGMYVGTIHGFCLKALRDYAPDMYYMCDVVDDGGRMALVEQGYNGVLGLNGFRSAAESAQVAAGRFRSQELFLRGYDLLNEHGQLRVSLPASEPPVGASGDRDWCTQAVPGNNVGQSALASAFATSAARYYAYLRARRFLDFSTIQSEVTTRLRNDVRFNDNIRRTYTRLVVDEVQDINPVQDDLIKQLVGPDGHLTAVGDHRQAIYSFRGGRVELMGKLSADLSMSDDGHIQELPSNYRSTPRIIALANKWSATIRDTAGMSDPPMTHRRPSRTDIDDLHVCQLHFNDRASEAEWIASTISTLVPPHNTPSVGAFHDDQNATRGLTLTDIAILVRSGTDIRTYQDALRHRGIPAVVRGGPDLYSQPEVLLFLSSLAICAGIQRFYGYDSDPRTVPGRIKNLLGVPATPYAVVPAAAQELRNRGLAIPAETVDRLLLLCRAIEHRLRSDESQPHDLSSLDCGSVCRRWLTRKRRPRRIFPQTLFHWILRESGISHWPTAHNRAIAESTLFHVGQLSSLIKAIEASGWTPADSLQWQLIALLHWGSSSARSAETPLLVSPDAVSITTIHSAKGLEYAAVFLADVCARRFPSNRARTVPKVPFDPGSPDYIDPSHLADNDNYDSERRLMYVAITRAERYLYITASGRARSAFFKTLSDLVAESGGVVPEGTIDISPALDYHPSATTRERRLATSFSDLRYFLECPQDFYLRNVLGFNPTIGQEFGYGRGLHNLLRVVHTDPAYWASLARQEDRLRAEVQALIDRGLFYLRYTVGQPLSNLQRKAKEGVVEYVMAYVHELSRMHYEPEKEFETLLADEQLLIAGAIDVLRLDDPPRVSIVDFKSGEAEEETGTGLSRDLMALQIGVYGLAARDELEYDPQHGLIRYIGEPDSRRRQLEVDLSDEELSRVRETVVQTGRSIRERDFNNGPTGRVPNRCAGCDFLHFCPRKEADRVRRTNP